MGHASNAIRSLDAALGVEGASAPPSVDFSRLRSPDMTPSPANSDLSQLSSSTLFRAKQQLDILQHKQQARRRFLPFCRLLRLLFCYFDSICY
jgi:hypothetical protein